MEPDIISEKNNVLNVFDEVIFKHLERLIGSRYGVGELRLNSITISLIMLLMERENEIESFPSNGTDRYKIETLIDDFMELGFDAAEDMNIVVEEMIRKGYIHIDDDRFIPQKPAISMARLIDLVFPKMPGMNLVAYFVQTMDEVTSERKDLDSAITQFDQVLKMQSVPLKKELKQSKPSNVSIQSSDKEAHLQSLDEPHQNNQKINSERELKTPIILGRKSPDNFTDQTRGSSTEPRVLSSDNYKGKIEIRKVDFGKPNIKEVEPDKEPSYEHKYIEDDEPKTNINIAEIKPQDEAESIRSDTNTITSSQEPPDTVHDERIQGVDIDDSSIASSDAEASVTDTSSDLKSIELGKNTFYNIKENSLNAPPSQVNIEDVKETVEDAQAIPDEKEHSLINDDDVEKRIVAFEDDLALECPLCRQSKILIESTSMGKSYYKCSNKECNFISWGKPHHISCPKCNNLFLIEASDKAGKTILKCPRATCRYWKKTTLDTRKNHMESTESESKKPSEITSISRKPRKRVVRRRVVRRKK